MLTDSEKEKINSRENHEEFNVFQLYFSRLFLYNGKTPATMRITLVS